MKAYHHQSIDSGLQFRETLRAGPYAWPGCYPVALLCSDGETLCFDCGRSESRQIIRSIRDRSNDGWSIVGCFIHWEGEPMQCAHCGRGIPSAYGECDE